MQDFLSNMKIFGYDDYVLLIILVILVGLFLAFRVVNLWYWKIDIGINLLKEQNRLLRKIAGEKESSSKVSIEKEGFLDTEDWKCPECKHLNSSLKFACEDCDFKLN